MKLDNEDKMLIGAGVLAVGVLGFFWWKNKKKQQEALQPVETPIIETPAIPEMATPSFTPPKVVSLDRDKILEKGSKGLEVKALQKLLNVPQDGDFGNITMNALFRAKNVYQISLNSFREKATGIKNTVKELPKKGARLMAVVGGTNIFNAKKLANGAIINSGEKGLFSSFEYGAEVGNFVRNHTNGYYLITSKGRYYFVKADNVKPF